MKNVFYLIIAIIIVAILWGIVKSLVFGLLGTIFQFAMIALFCYVVYLVYKAMVGKQRI